MDWEEKKKKGKYGKIARFLNNMPYTILSVPFQSRYPEIITRNREENSRIHREQWWRLIDNQNLGNDTPLFNPRQQSVYSSA